MSLSSCERRNRNAAPNEVPPRTDSPGSWLTCETSQSGSTIRASSEKSTMPNRILSFRIGFFASASATSGRMVLAMSSFLPSMEKLTSITR
jgi:hypothetical protein